MDVLPIRVLQDEDGVIFGKEGVTLGKLLRLGLPICPGLVVCAPNLRLKTVLEHHNFSSIEVFEQSLTLVRKEISQMPIPEILEKELGKHKKFLFKRRLFKTKKELHLSLLHSFLEQIKSRIWQQGFYPGITEGLDPKIVNFVGQITAAGEAYYDSLQDDVVISVFAGKIHPNDAKKLFEAVKLANKKLLLPNVYEWIVERGVKIVGLKPFTPTLEHIMEDDIDQQKKELDPSVVRSAIKVFLDLSDGFTIEKNVDGIFISSEKIFDLNKPRESFEDLSLRLVESAASFPNSPVLFKLADKSEGMGKVRGSLRLLHQKSLLDPLIEAVQFGRNKKGFKNIHVVIPFVRSVEEVLQIKRELAVKKLIRKSSLEIWLEIAIPENIVNLEDYLELGVDGIVLNLDELIAYLNGFDHLEPELMFYKNEVSGLLKFLEDSLKILHKSKVPFIATGSLNLYPEVLEFLVEKGVYGMVVQKYEAHSIKDLLHQAERKVILKRVS